MCCFFVMFILNCLVVNVKQLVKSKKTGVTNIGCVVNETCSKGNHAVIAKKFNYSQSYYLILDEFKMLYFHGDK